MASGSLRRQIGRLLVAGFDGLQLPVELRSLAREFGLGGVILFARNVAEPGQVAELSYEAARLLPDLPLWVSVDQEGGRVARLKSPFTEWPPMAALGRSGDVALVERFARALAAELRAVGVTLDYAPVLDVLTNSDNPVIGDRALSSRAEDVARYGAALIRTLQAEGIAACGKHFPGHGDTSTDSHLELPLVEHPPERLREVEFLPFRAAVAAGVATIMTAHVLVPSLDETRPATLSRRIVSGLLREELGYGGVILSDDLEMKAVANEYSVPSAAVLAIEAGCDGVLICSGNHDQQAAALESLVHAVEEERLPYARVEDALMRQQRAKERFLAASSPVAGAGRPLGAQALRQVLGCDEHRAIADEMARFA
jgi:beta-N-acetylhexosaminidase